LISSLGIWIIDNTPYITYLNPSFNAIFVEFYEYAPKEDNYLTKKFLSYLKFLHNYGLNVLTFVELYPFNAIKSIKENNVKFRTLFEKCTMAYSTSLCKNCFTFIVSSPNIFFYFVFAMFFWIFQSHWFIWLIYFQTFTTTICIFFKIINVSFCYGLATNKWKITRQDKFYWSINWCWFAEELFPRLSLFITLNHTSPKIS